MAYAHDEGRRLPAFRRIRMAAEVVGIWQNACERTGSNLQAFGSPRRRRATDTACYHACSLTDCRVLCPCVAVIVLLGLYEEDTRRERAMPEMSEIQADEPLATILVLDDESVSREYLTTLLGYGGYRLLEARYGEEALAITRQEQPDLIVADILMPGMDGYEFVRELRNDPRIASSRVIFYTAAYHERSAQALVE